MSRRYVRHRCDRHEPHAEHLWIAPNFNERLCPGVPEGSYRVDGSHVYTPTPDAPLCHATGALILGGDRDPVGLVHCQLVAGHDRYTGPAERARGFVATPHRWVYEWVSGDDAI